MKPPSVALPLPGDVGPLEPDSTRFYKVSKHLLNRGECWYLVCPGLPRDPFPDALGAGCSAYVLQPGVNQFEHTPEGCRRHILGAHDRYYEPAYRRELVSGAKSGHLAFLPNTGGKCAAAVGQQGVFVLLHRTSQVAWNVKTAFRKERRGSPETHEAFHERALRYWEKQTSTPTGANTMSAEPMWTDVITRRLGALLDRIERQGVQSLNEEDAASALVLLANAEQYPGSAPLGILLQRGQPHVGSLVATARFEDAEHLLQALDTALDESEEPHGLLHHVLLDFDDWLSVSVFLERHGHPAPPGMGEPERHRMVRLAGERLARAADQLLPLAGWALERARALTPEEGAGGDEAFQELRELWRAVAGMTAEGAPASQPSASSIRSRAEEAGRLVRRVLGTFSLSLLRPPLAAHAGSGIDLGPEPKVLHREGDALLELVVGSDLSTPMLQVSGLRAGDAPTGARDGSPLTFTLDEFDAWLVEARPGSHQVTFAGVTVDFTLEDT